MSGSFILLSCACAMTREATPFAGRLGRRDDEALFRRQRGQRIETGRAMQLLVGCRKQTGFLAIYSHGRRALPPC
jgi:hypothetical protein